MTTTDFDAIDYFRARDLYQDPYAYYEYVRSHGPVWREPRRGDRHGHRLRGSSVGVQRHRAVLQLQHGERPVRAVPGAVHRRRRQRPHRPVPRHAAVQRPAPVVRPAQAHGPPRVVAAVDHAEAAEGERGVHVAARRPPARHVRAQREVRVHRRLRQAVHAARHRRPARRPRGGPRGVPRRAPGRRGPEPRQRDRAPAARLPLRPLHRVHRGPPAQPAQRRDDRARHGDVPRRHAPRRARHHAHRRQPLLRRRRDHGPDARHRAAVHRRGRRAAGAAARLPRDDPRVPRGVRSSRVTDPEQLPDGARRTRRSEASTSPPAPR